ncbi:hypothetical protein K9N08_00630 [Candidatus Gracilibacteria bacterium]|nr:hypothetical protein [Candidatus Gracilibacteria bacterium]MCF7856048.1 hypothetical protein [Candidatus Gracilibacteria bacterium]MCF7896397.1 hypothetical protein [Candidatus Gracilibacteria bacterium]
MPDFFHQLRQKFSDTRGVSLLVTFGLTIVLVTIATGVTQMILGFMRTTKQVELANVAYSAAEGGIEMALYDLAAYEDGYETDPDQLVCGASINVAQSSDFSTACGPTKEYRFANFTGANLSGGRGFWRLFSRTLDSDSLTLLEKYYTPNPYFVGDKDGNLETGEWGELTKSNPISLSLLTDNGDLTVSPSARFDYLLKNKDMKIIFDAGADFDDDYDSTDDDEELFTWTLSALDVGGDEFTLQGVVWESDFTDDCTTNGGSANCFIFDLKKSTVLIGTSGDAYAGEDINKNLDLDAADALHVSGFPGELNRVSSVEESFAYATPQEFIVELNQAMTDGFIPDWESARLTINLIATLAETSGVTSNALNFKLESDEPWADEFTYIVSEGFAANIKQTIQTRFRRESAISIFSYVIFQ